MKSRLLHLLACVLLLGPYSFGQVTDTLRVDFVTESNRSNNLDRLSYKEWKDNYQKISVNGKPYHVAYARTEKETIDTILFIFYGAHPGRLKFSIGDSILPLRAQRIAGDTFALALPPSQRSYELNVHYKRELAGRLQVLIYPKIKKELIIVPLVNSTIDLDSLKAYLDNVFRSANISFKIQIKPSFQADDELHLLSNPSPQHDRFTEQMIMLRDAYFDKYPPNGAYYLFLTEGFINENITGYAVRNKALCFVKLEQEDVYRSIAQQLGHAAGGLQLTWLDGGPLQGTSDNLMDDAGGTRLTFVQWENLQLNARTISYYDEFENVQTNNGIIAYYFWEEDEKGNIMAFNSSFAKAIRHPFKRNQYSLHLDIDNWLFLPIFSVEKYDICALHLLTAVLLFILVPLLRKRFTEWLTKKIRVWRILRWTIRGVFFGSTIIVYIGLFLVINKGYMLFEVKEGQLEYLTGTDIHRVEAQLNHHVNTARLQEAEFGSEILVRRGDNWYLERVYLVLFFEVRKKGGEWNNCRFKKSSDQLVVTTQSFSQPAQSHYYVFRYISEGGKLEMEKVFNHAGSEITDKLNLADPARRILLLVNGYRPTSLGRTFEENFKDIQQNGLEYPNSNNLLYDFDRYEYWTPWKQMNEQFKKRINPSEVYYADGHFSVATSNHRSLIDFTTLSTSYPHRCEQGHHVCQKSKVNDWYFFSSEGEQSTSELLQMEPNVEGFNERRKNGRIAGRNLLSMLNELPNHSANDTLYLVAHSMGYAYSLGMLDVLRGKINFGGFYIIAPENASSGKLIEEEWKEVWQFGSRFRRYAKKAPCLLDGIAPQRKAAGLSSNHRVFMPDRYYSRMGFFDSHFIGHYNWIFAIPEGEPGFIQQR